MIILVERRNPFSELLYSRNDKTFAENVQERKFICLVFNTSKHLLATEDLTGNR